MKATVKKKINNLISNLNFEESIIFCCIIFKRLYPNYVAFNNRNQFSDSEQLWNLYKKLSEVTKGQNLQSISSQGIKESLYDLMPDTEDFSDPLVSSALDAASTLFELNEYLLDQNKHRILSVSEIAFDTVEMYLLDQYDRLNDEINKSVDNDPLMIKEGEFQLSLLSDIKSEVDVFSKYDNLKGSLEIEY